jgi:ABC-2 type transport system permease protein
MNSMTALMKREFLDHKGAMFWAQMVIGALLSLAIIWGAFSIPSLDKHWGKINIGQMAGLEKDGMVIDKDDGTKVTRSSRKLADGREEITITVADKNGKQLSKFVVNRKPGENIAPSGHIDINGHLFNSPTDALKSLNTMPAQERIAGARMIGSGLFAGTAVLPLLLALLMVPFILLASLYDERQDRSILFWKSLPVSDSKVVISKLVYGALLTFGIALAVGIIVHLIALISASTLGARYGVMGVGALWHLPTLLNTWGTWTLVVLQYILWAMPVYAWFLLVSAAAPRAPFLFAFMIPAAVGMLEGLWNHTGHFAETFFGRLGGAPMIDSIQALSVNVDTLRAPEQFLAIAQQAVLNGFGKTDLWIGLAIAAALLYATIEIRRRKTL